MKRLVFLLVSYTCFIFSSSAQSSQFIIDTTFHSLFNDDINSISSVVKQSNKLVIGGSFAKIAGTPCKNICRLLNDSVVDPNFITGKGFNNAVKKIFVLPSDKMYVMGAFTSYSNVNINYLIKLNADGTPDLSFIPNFDVGSVLIDFVVQSDEMLVVVGDFNTYSGYSRRNLVRLKPNGNLDLTFNCGDANNGVFDKVVLQSSDKIILIGKFNAHLSTPTSGIVRLLSNGNVDNSFSYNSNLASTEKVFTDIFIHPNDEISLLRYNVYPKNFSRYNSNGTLLYDYSFPLVTKAILLENGNFLSAQDVGANNNIIINEYSINGTIEKKYTPSGTHSPHYDPVSLFSIDNDIYIGSNYFENYNLGTRRGLIRLLQTSEIDFHFLPQDGPDFSITDLVKHSTNKYVIIGGFTRIGSSKVNTIAMIDSNGVVDPSFNSGKGFNGPTLSVAIQLDGRIIVGGDFTQYNDQQAPRIIRLMPDGSVDQTFNIGSGLDFPVFDIEIINSDQILLGGVFGKYKGSDVSNLLCLNSDGSMNTSFNANIGSASNGRIRRIRKAESKLYLIGDFNYFNGNLSKHIVRIGYSGAYDNTFNPGQADNGSLNDAVEFDGKLYVTGDFTNYNNLPMNSIAKLNLDGTSVENFMEANYHGSKLLPGINLEIVSNSLVFAGAFARSGDLGGSSYRAMSFDIEENSLVNEAPLFVAEIGALTLFPGDSSDYYQKHLKLSSYEDEWFIFGSNYGGLSIGFKSIYVNFLVRYKIAPPIVIPPDTSFLANSNVSYSILNGELTIIDADSSQGMLSIYDMQGQEELNVFYKTNTGVNIMTLSPGIYIIRFDDQDKNKSVRIKIYVN